jgi:hypothetical protein
MQRFVPALKRLSRGGMSEDESDHAPTSEDEEDKDGHISQSLPKGRRFKIVNMKWRSQEATKWLRTMDLIYVGTKFYEDRTAMPGSQFRERYPSDKVEIGRAIRGLPRNFYDVQWLQRLSPFEQQALEIQPEIDINFTENERGYVPFPVVLVP